MTITINGVEVALEYLPELIDSLDGALIITKKNHVLLVSREGKAVVIDDLTAKGWTYGAFHSRQSGKSAT
jgi:hypothetical protein